jgi:hypothetical protein
MADRDVRGAAIWSLRIRARGLVLAHLILRNGELTPAATRLRWAPGDSKTTPARPGRGHHLWWLVLPCS